MRADVLRADVHEPSRTKSASLGPPPRAAARHRGAASGVEGPTADLSEKPTFDVIRAIDFDHGPLRGSVEIRDEAPEQRHLPANDRAQAPAADAPPQELLGCSW